MGWRDKSDCPYQAIYPDFLEPFCSQVKSRLNSYARNRHLSVRVLDAAD